jgi:hypothetical protein
MPAKIVDQLRPIAMALGDVEEGIACKGTAIESSTFKANKKAFLFVGAGAVRLKLDASLADARKLAAKDPDKFDVGAGGWIKIAIADGEKAPLTILKKWISESHDVLTTKAAGGKPVKKKKAR